MTDHHTLEIVPPPTGVVFNIMRFAVHDGPGIRTTVFLKGCPLQCAWCHNPEGLSIHPELVIHGERCLRCGDCCAACPQNAIVREGVNYQTNSDQCIHCGSCVTVCSAEARELLGREMTVDHVMAEVEKDRVFYEESGGGITVSGGEPLLQHRFVIALLRACKERGFHTIVDTTGYSSPAVLQAVSEYTDLFLYDLKSMDENIHRMYTGVSNGLLRGNLGRLASWGKKVILRIPVVPGINDLPGNIEATGRFVASLGNVVAIQLLPYHAIGADKYERLGRHYALTGTQTPTNESMIRIANDMSRFHHAVSIGG